MVVCVKTMAVVVRGGRLGVHGRRGVVDDGVETGRKILNQIIHLYKALVDTLNSTIPN